MELAVSNPQSIGEDQQQPASESVPEAKIGRVVQVTGFQVVAILDNTPGTLKQSDRAHLQMGQLVKMLMPDTGVFGVVSGLSIPLPSESEDQPDMMIVEVELLGEADLNSGDAGASFRRGVSTLPQLGDPLFAATREDLAIVYAPPNAVTAEIGMIHQDRSLPAYVITNDLLGKHYAILGTTGCGKSCATALVLQGLVDQNPNAHIVLLDPHNEYAHAFGDRAEILNPSTLELPYWMLEFDELLEIVGGGRTLDNGEISILSAAIPAAKVEFLGPEGDARRITVDTPVPYRLTQLVQRLDDAMGKLDKAEEVAAYQRLKGRLKMLQSDPRYAFMFGGVSIRDNMHRILSKIFRVPVDGKPVTILDLSGVPSEIVNVVVSLLCRLTFDFALWADRQVPVLLVCEEAHRYAPQSEAFGFEPAKRALSRIAKEGRKYGVSLCLVSQRPSELAAGILSQCNTIFAMRMTNHQDQEILRGTLSESSMGLLDALPSLGNAEAIAVGEGVAVPMRLCFRPLPENERPRSATADFHQAWQADQDSDEFMKAIVQKWRQLGR